MFDKVFVSTDSQKYANIAIRYGADASFLRSEENSSDTAGSLNPSKRWGLMTYHAETRESIDCLLFSTNWNT